MRDSPLQKVQLHRSMEAQQVQNLGHNRGGSQKTKPLSLHEAADVPMVKVVFVKQGHKRAGINENGVEHVACLLVVACR